MKDGDREAAAAAEKPAHRRLREGPPDLPPAEWIEENLEVFFVAIVVALGIRAYYLQPFRIPTGSMQPTLNGITGEAMRQGGVSRPPGALVETVLRGRSYVHNELDRDRTFRSEDLSKAIVESPALELLHLHLPPLQRRRARIHAPRRRRPRGIRPGEKLDIMPQTRGRPRRIPAIGTTLPAGTVLASGTVDSGDLVLVDKVSYHFRRPEARRGLRLRHPRHRGHPQALAAQGAGSHYIKRLSGVPGDTLRIEPPQPLVNGKIPTEEKSSAHVMDQDRPRLSDKPPRTSDTSSPTTALAHPAP